MEVGKNRLGPCMHAFHFRALLLRINFQLRVSSNTHYNVLKLFLNVYSYLSYVKDYLMGILQYIAVLYWQ